MTKIAAAKDLGAYSELTNPAAPAPVAYLSKADKDEAEQWENLVGAGREDYDDDIAVLGLR